MGFEVEGTLRKEVYFEGKSGAEYRMAIFL